MKDSPDITPVVPPQSTPADETIQNAGEDTRSIQLQNRTVPEPPPEAESPPEAPVPKTGDTIGPIVLEQALGSGASSYVFRGWNQSTQSHVAVKVLNWANVVDRNAAMRQLRIEAVTLARVKHPRVLQFIDFGYDHRWPYLITEFIDGQPLGELLRSGGTLPLAWSMYIFNQVVDALGAVWKAGLVHRDIKPDNILVATNGMAKLIDFGLAKQPLLQANSGQVGPELAGTASYLAPEQAKDASVVDLRADIYSLGVTFFEALTGQLPFAGKNRVQMIYHHIHTAPINPCTIAPDLPPLIADLCLWMLVKNPAERPQNYEELRAGFDAVQSTVTAAVR